MSLDYPFALPARESNFALSVFRSPWPIFDRSVLRSFALILTHTMKPNPRLPIPFHATMNPRRVTLGLFAFLLPVAIFAQSATGVISGRVFNPATGEYIR